MIVEHRMTVHSRNRISTISHDRKCENCGWSGPTKRNVGYCPKCNSSITNHTRKTREPYLCWGGHPLTKTTDRCKVPGCGSRFNNSRYRKPDWYIKQTLEPQRWSGSAAPYDISAGFFEGTDIVLAEKGEYRTKDIRIIEKSIVRLPGSHLDVTFIKEIKVK
jgi:Zn finger protein HypA/HybF involved in hydrogenase expression